MINIEARSIPDINSNIRLIISEGEKSNIIRVEIMNGFKNVLKDVDHREFLFDKEGKFIKAVTKKV